MLERRLKEKPSPFDAAQLSELYLTRGKREGDPKDFETAEAMAKRSLELQPNANTVRVNLGKLATVKHDFRKAIALIQEQFQEKHLPEAYLVLVTAHLALGELREALDAANAVIERQPSSTAYLHRALVLEQTGRDAEASHDFTHAVALESFNQQEESALLRTLWARFLMRRGEHEGAKLVLDEAARISSKLPVITAFRGEVALRTGDANGARKLYEDAFAKGRQVRYLIDQARAIEVGGDRPAANELRKRIEGILRQDLESGHRLELVEVLVDMGDPAKLDEAVTLAGKELELRASSEVRFHLARAMARRANVNAKDAMKHVQDALATGIHDARLYELASHLDMKLGNTLRSAVYAYEAKRLDPQGTGWRKLGIGPPP